MATVTLLQLRDLAKQESDNVGASFISDAEWNSYISRSYSELYGLIVSAFGDEYFVQTPSAGYTFTTDGVNVRFALPSAFFKLRGVDVQAQGTGQQVSLKQFNMADRNRFSAFSNSIPMAGQTITVWYTPLPTLPAADGDTINGVNGWEEYIIIDAAIKALTKEEADVSVLMQRKQEMKRRLEEETENRNAGAPHTISDTIGRGARGMMYRLDGSNLWLIGGTMPGWSYDWAADAGAW